MAGRKVMSELDKSKSKASRLYWKHQDTLTSEFKEEHQAKELHFFESDKRMGRPPLKLSLIQSRALSEYSDALDEFREVELKEGLEPITDQEIIDFKKSDRAGRKAKDEVLHIRKYIRRTQKQISDIEAQDDSEFKAEQNGPGRPGMPKLEKVEYYKDRIKEAEAEIEKLLVGKAEHEVIYYSLFELKNDRRKLVVEQKKHDEDSAEYDRIEKELGSLDEQIAPVQVRYDKALELAGVKMIRSAPSARASARSIDVQVCGWAGSQKSAGKTEVEQSEKSEVEMLKIQMLEI
ncbi:MAG: CCR4-NOT transcriptional regulation complex NOT5 subunit, partial [Oleiphilaceae bacterium]